MNPERWSEVQKLFYSALEREQAGRAAFLASACAGDNWLRREVEALLAADEKATNFLSPRSTLALEPGCNLGAYRILALIGRGGMGEVYRAWDERLAREVAIKVSNQPGVPMPSPDQGGAEASLTARKGPIEPAVVLKEVAERDALVARRFEREALLTASVQHPAVVPIYERGELPDGRPFYAMKLVSGRSLRELIDARKTLSERIGLLPNVIAVAEALAHAHWHHIIHRDVKPSNIIVGEFGETVLIDWGLAKNLAQYTEESARAGVQRDSHHTVLGEIIGTPAYMSPEQAKGLSVDERADVFSLGATLYHVLTGRAPYEGDTPSILPHVKQGEYASLNELQPELPSELIAITNKAMAREPSQRYPTARELAEDLRRFQAGQLVLSHRYSPRELVWRWAKRHRKLLLATAAFIAVAAVAGAIGIRRIVAERERADREAEASQRVSQFMIDMFKVSNPSEARGNNITAREILEKASKQIEGGLAKDPELRTRLLDTIALVYDSLGLYTKAEPLAEKAVEMRQKLLGPEHPDTLRSMSLLANIKRRLGRHADAESLHRQILEIRRRVLGPEHPETVASMSNLGIDEREQGRYAEAEKHHQQVLEIRRRVLGPEHPDTLGAMNHLAVDEREQGQYAASESLSRQLLDVRLRVLGPEHPDTMAPLHNLAEIDRALGRNAEAEKILNQLLETQRRVLGPDHPLTLGPMASLGSLYLMVKRLEDSEKIRREALDLSRRVLGPEHPRTLSAISDVAEVESARGRHGDAEKHYREALDLQQRVLGSEHPNTLATKAGLANVWGRQGRYDESERLQLEALSIRRRVLGPSHPQVGLSLYSLGSLAAQQGDRKKALDYLRQAVDHGLSPGDIIKMEDDDELDPLRSAPEFKALVTEAKPR